MKLSDVQGEIEKKKTSSVTARIPLDYKEWLIKKKINVRKLIEKAIEELKRSEEK